MKYNFEKVVRIGKREGMNIFAKIKYKDGKLSITGVEGPKRNGDAKGGAGQIIMSYKEYDERGYASIHDIEPAPGWDISTIKSFFDIWDKYHLNDMQAGCEHQRKLWNPSEKITIAPLHTTMKYYRESEYAKDGKMTPRDYEKWAHIVTICEQAWLHDKISDPDLYTDEIKEMIAEGYLEVDAKHTETKTAGWVYPTQHHKGILTKECPICGYKYGTSWLKMEIPLDVFMRLTRYPETDITPAWV